MRVAVSSIRPAVHGDLPAIEQLVRDFLVDMQQKGSEVIPSTRTVDFYTGVAALYLEGAVEGIVLVAQAPDDSRTTRTARIVGVTIAGHSLPFDTIYGKTATGWLTFVVPEARGSGLGTRLRQRLRESLCRLGYTAIAAGYHVWNEESRRFVERRGFKAMQVYGIDILRNDRPDPEAC